MMKGYIYDINNNNVVARISSENQTLIEKFIEENYDLDKYGLTYSPAFGTNDGLVETTDTKEMELYTIEVAGDTEEGEEFVAWLNEHGHTAKLGRTSADYIDGVDTSDIEANEIMRDLYSEYCSA